MGGSAKNNSQIEKNLYFIWKSEMQGWLKSIAIIAFLFTYNHGRKTRIYICNLLHSRWNRTLFSYRLGSVVNWSWAERWWSFSSYNFKSASYYKRNNSVVIRNCLRFPGFQTTWSLMVPANLFTECFFFSRLVQTIALPNDIVHTRLK